MDVWSFLIRKAFYPYMELLKGNQIRRKLRYLKERENWSAEQLQQEQKEKLTRLLLHCIYNVPAYQKFKSLEKEIKADPIKALENFPVLTKTTFRENPDQYLASGVNLSNCIPNLTGGSTGEPVRFYMDRETVEWYEAARWQGLSWWGIDIGDRSVMVWGSPIELNQQQSKKYELKEKYLKNRQIIPAYHINPNQIQAHLAMLKSYQPKYLYGYASAFYVLAQEVQKSGLTFPLKLKGVVSTSENLYDFQREKIAEVFNCPAVNEYGARDGGIIAYQCPEGKMHLMIQNGFYEAVDIKTKVRVPGGQEGSLLITDLHNYVMPRLRYEVGDMVAIGPAGCGCQRNTPVLQAIEGRVDDTFIAKDGSFVHGHYFNHVVRTTKGIKQFQLIQHTPATVTLKIVKGEAFSQEELNHVIFMIEDKLGQQTIDLQFVDEIPLSKSGKVRYAIREYSL